MFMKAQIYNVTNGKKVIILVLAFMGCSLIHKSSLPLKIAISAFIAGQTLFIAPLYYTAVTDKKHSTLMKLMPVGGSALIIGWTSLLFAAWKNKEKIFKFYIYASIYMLFFLN